jgi:hypothetical protein
MAALLLAGAVAFPQVAWATSARKTVEVRAVVRHPRPYRCVLWVGPTGRRATASTADGGSADGGSADGGSADASPSPTTRPQPTGDMTVEIPPVAIVRAHGRRLFVTTNTEGPPNAREAIYYVSTSSSGVAPDSIRELVIAGCPAHSIR